MLRALYGRVSELVSGAPSALADVNSMERQLADDVLVLIGQLQSYSSHYVDLASRLEDQPTGVFTTSPPPAVNSGTPGRPAFQVSQSQLEGLIELGFNFRQIADLIGVSERTVRRRRVLYGLPVGDNFSLISDVELDDIVADILQVICNVLSPCLWVTLIVSIKHTCIGKENSYALTPPMEKKLSRV